jgi:hypothetical protein
MSFLSHGYCRYLKKVPGYQEFSQVPIRLFDEQSKYLWRKQMTEKKEEITNLSAGSVENTGELSIDDLDEAAGGGLCVVHVECGSLICGQNTVNPKDNLN